MLVKTNQAWTGLFVTTDDTKAIVASTGAPVGTLYVDGVANVAAVTITGANPYKWAVTLPTLTAGQTVSMYITATVGAVSQAFVTAEAIADTARISEMPLNVWDYSAGIGAPDTYGGIVDSLTEESGGEYRFTAFALGKIATLTVPASLAAGAITSSTFATGAITATAIAADAIGSSELADSAVTEIAAGVGSVAGSGAITHTITINDGTNPIEGASVWVSTDSAGSNVIAGTLTTTSLGQAVFYLDAGTYYAWMQKSGFNFTNPTAITVA